MRLHAVLLSERTARLLLVAASALGLAACAPPMPPESGAHVVPESEAPIPATIKDALQGSARQARDYCLGRGYGEALVTFDSSGAVTRAKVARTEEIADAECVEAVFRKAHVPAFAGPPMTIVASFELDSMRGPNSAPVPADLRKPRFYP